jgi:hypothetical protein
MNQKKPASEAKKLTLTRRAIRVLADEETFGPQPPASFPTEGTCTTYACSAVNTGCC